MSVDSIDHAAPQLCPCLAAIPRDKLSILQLWSSSSHGYAKSEESTYPIRTVHQGSLWKRRLSIAQLVVKPIILHAVHPVEHVLGTPQASRVYAAGLRLKQCLEGDTWLLFDRLSPLFACRIGAQFDLTSCLIFAEWCGCSSIEAQVFSLWYVP